MKLNKISAIFTFIVILMAGRANGQEADASDLAQARYCCCPPQRIKRSEVESGLPEFRW